MTYAAATVLEAYATLSLKSKALHHVQQMRTWLAEQSTSVFAKRFSCCFIIPRVCMFSRTH